jgi:hypothetical protein
MIPRSIHHTLPHPISIPIFIPFHIANSSSLSINHPLHSPSLVKPPKNPVGKRRKSTLARFNLSIIQPVPKLKKYGRRAEGDLDRSVIFPAKETREDEYLFRFLYSLVLRCAERIPCRVVSCRHVVSKWKKVQGLYYYEEGNYCVFGVSRRPFENQDTLRAFYV